MVHRHAFGRDLALRSLLVGGLLLAAVIVVVAWSKPASAHQGVAGHSHGLSCQHLEGVGRMCTHGPDEEPTAESTYGAASAYAAAATTTPKVACIGDGRSGPRVQVIYARPKNRPDRYADSLEAIRRSAGLADFYVNRSAAQRGSGRRIRFVTENCRVKVLRVTVSRTAAGSFNSTIQQLANKGYNKRDRKYLIYMEASALCGIGTNMPDDSGGATNANNLTTGFARLDRGCWQGGIAAHELFHTFGAVQNSAPYSNGAGHCVDENDAMCYDDGSGAKLRTLCGAAIEWQIDCGHNTYFNPKPRAGSYLDTHWNTARSRFLEPGIAPPRAPVIRLPDRSKRIPGLTWALSASSKAAGSRRIARWEWSVANADGSPHRYCKFANAGTATPTFWCAAEMFKDGYDFLTPRISVSVYDSAGDSNVTVARVPLASTDTRRSVKLTLVATPDDFPADYDGGLVTLTARLRDAATGRPIVGMPLGLNASTGWSTTATTSRAGNAVRSTKVSKTSLFSAYSPQTTWWKQFGLPYRDQPKVTVPLRPVTMTAQVKAGTSCPATGTTITVAPDAAARLCGTMSPVEPGDQWRREVILQYSPTGLAGSWKDLGYTYAYANTSGVYGVDLPTSFEGVTFYRVRKPAGTYAAAVSPAVQVTVQRPPLALSVPAATSALWAPWTWVGVPLTVADPTLWGGDFIVQRRPIGATTPWPSDPNSFDYYAPDAQVSDWDPTTYTYGDMKVWVQAQEECYAGATQPCGPAGYEYRVILRNHWTYADSESNVFTVTFTP